MVLLALHVVVHLPVCRTDQIPDGMVHGMPVTAFADHWILLKPMAQSNGTHATCYNLLAVQLAQIGPLLLVVMCDRLHLQVLPCNHAERTVRPWLAIAVGVTSKPAGKVSRPAALLTR
jgi:hypothetical protein